MLRLLSRRAFSGLPPRRPGQPLKLDSIVGVAETVLLFLEQSQFGTMLDEIHAKGKGKTLGERWRNMTEIMLHAQVHTIVPFGFSSDVNGIQAYAQGTFFDQK
jgi:hypothetical protein